MNYIVCVDKNFGVGKNNDLLFHLKGDMKYFREKTMGKTVVMGDRTLLSLPNGKPLAGRENIVLSLDEGFNGNGAVVCHSLPELFREIEKYNTQDVFVIGGATVYDLLMDYCAFAYITKVDAAADADRYIINIDEKENWKLKKTSAPQSEGGLEYTFCVYENSAVKPF